MDAPRPAPPRSLHFEAAVERPLSVVYRGEDGTWEGHDYRVEVIAAREGLDGFDVVVDFRDLEAALDALLEPLRGRLLGELGLQGPMDLVRLLAAELALKVPPPARLTEVALTDGQGRRLAYRP
ncbi:6-carboxytetrahydropterin synthase [Geothrix sp. 21YS21S-2]|uniref:6-pyruvoyl trahydropterin synthase family protein n=1 Tax=Geothrix sp. 21YS21S-2 TaxID=3068893 RepID=UPI0027BB004D|nr:6-carboxytetrahydropterin synthase [Geothrix sp. 21YS21S-2]